MGNYFKIVLKHAIKVLGGIGLVFLALLIFVAVVPFAFIWLIMATLKNKKNKARGVISNTGDFFIQIAASFDQLGNAAFGGFFNWLFVSNINYGLSHGNKDDTISEVLGWNQHFNTLSNTGRTMVYILDKLEKDHCKIAMEAGINNAKNKLALLTRN